VNETGKHSSLSRSGNNYGREKFYSTEQGANPIKLFTVVNNISLGWRGLPGTNTLAYYENP
jgi:hypothetical protein